MTYDLPNLVLRIKAAQKKGLVDVIEIIKKSGFLEPGRAGKLNDKLMFGASQLWGKVGRAFLLAISERQHGWGLILQNMLLLGRPCHLP